MMVFRSSQLLGILAKLYLDCGIADAAIAALAVPVHGRGRCLLRRRCALCTSRKQFSEFDQSLAAQRACQVRTCESVVTALSSCSSLKAAAHTPICYCVHDPAC